MGNKGAFIRLKGKELKPKYTQFDAVVIIKLITASPKHQANGLFTRVQRNVLIHLARSVGLSLVAASFLRVAYHYYMENTAVVELFGSFFVSLASQQDNKEELLKHFSNFKCALYSQQGNKTSDEVNRYLDSLEKQVTK